MSSNGEQLGLACSGPGTNRIGLLKSSVRSAWAAAGTVASAAGAAGAQEPRATRQAILRRHVGGDDLLLARAAVLRDDGDDLALARRAVAGSELQLAAGHLDVGVDAARLSLATAGLGVAEHLR